MQVDRYGAALALILLTIVVSALAVGTAWGRILSLLIQAVTLLFILRTSGARQRTVRLAAGAVAVALATGIGFAVLASGSALLASLVIGALMVLVAPAAIVRRLVQHERIGASTIFGALCLYLLAGQFFAWVFAAIGAVQPEGFFVQQSTAQISDYLYFSFVTLATLGYGDLTPRSNLGRMIAVSEALIGQLYLVSVVAILVSNVGRPGVFRADRSPVALPAPDDSEPAPTGRSLTEQLEQLHRWHAAGTLSDEEFEAAKRSLLHGPN